jgi:hypothetical protein
LRIDSQCRRILTGEASAFSSWLFGQTMRREGRLGLTPKSDNPEPAVALLDGALGLDKPIGGGRVEKRHLGHIDIAAPALGGNCRAESATPCRITGFLKWS